MRPGKTPRSHGSGLSVGSGIARCSQVRSGVVRSGAVRSGVGKSVGCRSEVGTIAPRCNSASFAAECSHNCQFALRVQQALGCGPCRGE